MKRLRLLFIFFAFNFTCAFAQPYTSASFQYDSLMDVPYGVAVDYAGNQDTLLMDIYKPNNDFNCLRPVMVLIHGGDWIGGSKEDPNIIYMARALAQRGWVVAAINYRLGTHKTSNYTMYAFCNNTISQPCAYICDSAEVFRANFRGMQDAKGAIRFMKNRNALDSTDVGNVYIAGESAGGFIAFETAFSDRAVEKNTFCGAITDAPAPDADLFSYGCIPAHNDLSRPDLGSIDGDLNIGTYDASIKGIANFYGAVLDLNRFQQVADTPIVYLFHQGSDVIVDYDSNAILGRISWECYAQSNLCQSYYQYPIAYGSSYLKNYFDQSNGAFNYQADLVANYSYMNNCLSNGHSIDNVQLRMQHMVDFFATKIADSGNDPAVNCLGTSIPMNENNSFTLSPNPFCGTVSVKIAKLKNDVDYTIHDAYGRIVKSGNINTSYTLLELTELPAGVYYFTLIQPESMTMKLVKGE